MNPAALMLFARAWWKAALGAALIFPMAFLLGQCSGADHATMKLRAQVAAANARAEAQNSALLGKAAVERAADTVKITDAAKGRADAIHAGADARTSGPECRLNRRRMLDAGAREADLPKCG